MLGIPILANPIGSDTTSGLPFSRLKGTLRKTHQCTACGASLEIAAETTGHVEGSVTTRRAPPFSSPLTAPALMCGSCGAVQLKSGTSTYSDVALGVDIAFATAGFRRNPLAFRSRSQAATSCR